MVRHPDAIDFRTLCQRALPPAAMKRPGQGGQLGGDLGDVRSRLGMNAKRRR